MFHVTSFTLTALDVHRSTFWSAVRSYWLDALRLDGRAGRSTSRFPQLHVVVNTAALSTVAAVGALHPVGEFVSALVTPVFALAVLVPQTTLLVRRLHDTGRSGWWALLELVPLVNLVVLVWTLLPSRPDGARFVSDTTQRRAAGPWRSVVRVVGAVLAGEAAVLVALELAAVNALTGAATLAALGAGADDPPLVIRAPGVFSVTATDLADPTAGLVSAPEGVGWHLSALAIAAALVLWRAAIDRHERDAARSS